jgi:Protein of unknown function, DUF599
MRGAGVERSCAVAVLGSDTPIWRALVRARLRSFWCSSMRKPGSTVRRIWREPGAPAMTRLRIDRGAWWHGLSGVSLLDWLTLIFFGLAWFGYEFVVDRTSVRKRSLNVAINEERHHWMQEMALVDNRIMDSNLHAA